MAPYRDKPTWALLPPSKLLPGAIALELLGRVVADIENPTDHYAPQNIEYFDRLLPKTLEAEQTSVDAVLRGATSSHVQIRLTQLFNSVFGIEQSQERRLTTQLVITRFLRDHPIVFKTLNSNDEYRREILDMMALNPYDKKTAYMVVGVKTCLDMKVSDVQKVNSRRGVGVELPVDAALALTGIPLPLTGASLDIRAEAEHLKHKDLLSSFTTVGERIFAIQYRQIKRHRDWLKWTAPSALKYGDLEPVSNDVGFFGEEGEDDDDDDDDDDNVDNETCAASDADDVPDDDALEIRQGLQMGVAVGNVITADL